MNESFIFKRMNPAGLEVALFIDDGFLMKTDTSSQIGFIMIFMDENMNANIIHLESVKYKPVTRSVLAGEMFAIVQGFGVRSTMCLASNKMFGNPNPLKIYTDSRSLFYCLIKINSKTDRKATNRPLHVARRLRVARDIGVPVDPHAPKPCGRVHKILPCKELKMLVETSKL